MGLPIGVTHDAIAQAEWGLSGDSVTDPQISGLALITFGYLWGQGDWASCFDAVSTSWSLCAGVTTTWSECYDAVVTGWSLC